MARCPECGKIWTCLNSDEELGRVYLTDEELRERSMAKLSENKEDWKKWKEDWEEQHHCSKCKCPDCRKEGDRITIEEEYYGKRK